MNRYSLVFAVLVAASFGVHSTRAGDSSRNGADKQRTAKPGSPGPELSGPVGMVQAFLRQAQPAASGAPDRPAILFALVPHPTETHLAEAFDHNIEGLQDGLQATGYLFDSAWIPWKFHDARDQFEDDEKEHEAKAQENTFPGLMLFRRSRPVHDPYSEGLVVFLVAERPTGGIYRTQAQQAIEIMKGSGIALSSEIRILGPTFSGSLPSLAPMVGDLLAADKQPADVLIRSGSFTSCGAAYRTLKELTAQHPGTKIDLGSTAHNSTARVAFVRKALWNIGIKPEHTVILTEGETLYGQAYRATLHEEKVIQKDASSPEAPTDKQEIDFCQQEQGWRGSQNIGGMWSIPFPRDISSLRMGYENQGLFDTLSPAQPWKRTLNLKNEEQGEGDSVHKFGGTGTLAAQESVLFGISEFINKHEIQAAIVLATNEQDRFFLTQFLHANNTNIRVVVLDPTRLFLRGSTAQFRGDLFVGEFPLLSWLHDWTAGNSEYAGHIFADDTSQGTFFSAVDLFADQSPLQRWYSEYTEPGWTTAAPAMRPPLYLIALGSNGMWPVAESAMDPVNSHSPDCGKPGAAAGCWQIAMPFDLFQHSLATKPLSMVLERPSVASTRVPVSRFWRGFFGMIAVLIAAFCVFFWCANPAARSLFSSFAPSRAIRFWVFKVTIPAAIAGCAFRVLAWSVAMPGAACWDAPFWWWWSEALTVLAPLAVAASATARATWRGEMERSWRLLIPFTPAAIAATALIFPREFGGDLIPTDVGSILNTYREMHWESELSLLPTAMLFLAAIFVWSCQASNGASMLAAAPPLPESTENFRISPDQAHKIVSIGRPFPFTWRSRWLWIAWIPCVAAIFAGQFGLKPFAEITSLESSGITKLVFGVSALITCLIVLDLLQFLWLWVELRALLRSLNRQDFRRSFVPINDFNWHSLWTFTGVSFQGRRAINSAHIDALSTLARECGLVQFEPYADKLERMRTYYDVVDPEQVSRRRLAVSRRLFFCILNSAGNKLMALFKDPPELLPKTDEPPKPAAPQTVIVCQCGDNQDRYKHEEDEIAKLPAWRKAGEKFVCLMYIGFIQVVISRLHTLLISISLSFSLMVLGIAIYPFLPLSPLLLTGVALMLLIALAFFRVFKEMDTDPVLARIVNGDDRKLQESFYKKFAESIALPMLTLASSLLPGGAGRLLELAQALFNHGQ